MFRSYVLIIIREYRYRRKSATENPSPSFLPYSKNIIHRNISYLIYDILDLVQILWKIVLIFMFCCSFLLFLFRK